MGLVTKGHNTFDTGAGSLLVPICNLMNKVSPSPHPRGPAEESKLLLVPASDR